MGQQSDSLWYSRSVTNQVCHNLVLWSSIVCVLWFVRGSKTKVFGVLGNQQNQDWWAPIQEGSLEGHSGRQTLFSLIHCKLDRSALYKANSYMLPDLQYRTTLHGRYYRPLNSIYLILYWYWFLVIKVITPACQGSRSHEVPSTNVQCICQQSISLGMPDLLIVDYICAI